MAAAFAALLETDRIAEQPDAARLSVAALGVSIIYGPESDPSLEVALATPTSPRLILLARLTLVFGYDLLLTLTATAGLVPLGRAGPGAVLSAEWLGPMLFLSAEACSLHSNHGCAPTLTSGSSMGCNGRFIWCVLPCKEGSVVCF